MPFLMLHIRGYNEINIITSNINQYWLKLVSTKFSHNFPFEITECFEGDTLRLCKYPFLLKISPTHLAPTGTVLIVIFYIPHSFSIESLKFICVGSYYISPIYFFFKYLFKLVQIHGYLFYFGSIIQTIVSYCITQAAAALGIGSSLFFQCYGQRMAIEWLCPFSRTSPAHLPFHLLAPSHFPATPKVPGSFYIFLVLVLETFVALFIQKLRFEKQCGHCCHSVTAS